MERIPVTFLAGSAGSGKTTLLNRLVGMEPTRDTLVVLTELGATRLDHALVVHCPREQQTAGLAACACCAPGQDVATTLLNAGWRFSRAGQRLFSRVAIEAGSLDQVRELARLLQTHKRLSGLYEIDCVLLAVQADPDGAEAVRQEPLPQAGAVDAFIITKTDTASTDAICRLEQKLTSLKDARALVLRAAQGTITPTAWTGLNTYGLLRQAGILHD